MDGEWEVGNHIPYRVIHQDRIPKTNNCSFPSRSFWPSYLPSILDSTRILHLSQFRSLSKVLCAASPRVSIQDCGRIGSREWTSSAAQAGASWIKSERASSSKGNFLSSWMLWEFVLNEPQSI